MEIVTLPARELAAYLESRQRESVGEAVERGGVSVLPAMRSQLDTVLETILRTANKFVPSSAGSILLEAEGGGLVFSACFGARSRNLLGCQIPAESGVVGYVYRSGKPYVSRVAAADPHFDKALDEANDFDTRNLLCVPVVVGDRVCGVLELLNRDDGPFAPEDLDLMTIFASYISASIQSALDAHLAHELAKRDELSGLFNDRYFHQRTAELVAEALERGETITMIFFDLDAFKVINDTHGHLAGAAILREVGHLLAEMLPEGAIAARYGGDEYVVVWPRAPLDEAEALAEEIRVTIREHAFLTAPNWLDAPVLHLKGHLSASIGVASLHELGLNSCDEAQTAKNRLIRAADGAMYRAKALGKNRVEVARGVSTQRTEETKGPVVSAEAASPP